MTGWVPPPRIFLLILLLHLYHMPNCDLLRFEVVALQVGVTPVLAASLSVTAASERITDLSLIQATLAQPTLSVPSPSNGLGILVIFVVLFL